MSFLDTFESENAAAINDLVARPPAAQPQQPKFSAWKMMTAAPRGVAAGANEAAGSTADILGAFGQVMAATDSRSSMFASQTEEEHQQEEKAAAKLRRQGPSFEAGDDLRSAAKLFMPDPTTAHASENVVFGLARFGSKALGYSALGGPVIGAGFTGLDEGLTASQGLKEQGVDIGTRTASGAVSGIGAAAGVLIPAAGKTAIQTAALVAAGGPGAFMTQQAATRQILQDAGYDQISMQFDPFDPVGLAVSTLVPAGFGAWAMRGARIKAVKAGEPAAAAPRPEPVPGEVAPSPAHETITARPTQEHVDAARVEMLSQHMEESGLYKPEDARAAAMHVEAFAKAMDDLSAGRRVDVTDLVPVDRIEVAKALDTFAAGLESTRGDLMSQAAMRAEPGAIRQMQAELADHQGTLAQVQDPTAIKARATELQQSDRLSYKQALAQAKKEFGAQAQDVQARITRLESLIDDNAQGQQALDALNLMDKQVEQAKQQRAQIDAPAARVTPTAAAAREATTPSEPAQAAANAKDSTQPAPAEPAASGAPLQPEASQSTPDAAAGPGAQREPGQGGGSGAGSAGVAAEAGVVAQRLAEIQSQFPDLTVQMDGMDKPVRLADFLAEVQREAMEGTEFDLGGNDAPLMQVAASCFLLNG